MNQMAIYSSRFVTVAPPKKKENNSKDQVRYNDYKKVMESELLSGGIDLKYIGIFSEQTKDKLKEHGEIT